MNSQALNDRLREICNEGERYDFCGYAGRAISYFGWVWRDVDFDRADGYSFGIDPSGTVAFMEQNKWGYSYVQADAEQWALIKELLIEAAGRPSRETLKAVSDAMQALAPAPSGDALHNYASPC